MTVVVSTGWDFNFAFMQYGDTWRAHRRIVHQHFGPEAIRNYHPLLISRNNNLLQNLLEEPETMVEQLKQCVFLALQPRLSVDDSCAKCIVSSVPAMLDPFP